MNINNILKLERKINSLSDEISDRTEMNMMLKEYYEIEVQNRSEMLSRNETMRQSIINKQESAEVLKSEVNQLKGCATHFEGEIKVSKNLFYSNANKLKLMVEENSEINELSVDCLHAIESKIASIDSLEGIVEILKSEIENKKNSIREQSRIYTVTKQSKLGFMYNLLKKVNEVCNRLFLGSVKTINNFALSKVTK